MAVFTVKATYHNETRKISFPDNVFPTYDKLYSQLYRVFPISHSFYLSKLLLSPDSSKPARILIGKEVHSAQEYDHYVAPYRGLSYPRALLRFSVIDETPHKSPSMSVSSSLPSDVISHKAESRPVSTSSTSAPSTAADSSAAEIYSHLRGDRRILLDRLMERTQRSAFNGIPPTPSASSRPTSMAESSRPTSLASEPEGWRPLPARPSSRDESATSTASTHTARPSLFDLLADVPPSNSASRSPARRSVASLRDLTAKGSVRGEDTPRWYTWQPFPPSDATPKLPSVGERSLPRPAFVAPPLPILFPQQRSYSRDTKAQGPQAEKDGAHASMSRADRTGASQPRTQSRPSAQHDVARSGSVQEERQRLVEFLNMDDTPLPNPKIDHCCSVEEGKAEVKALMDKFKLDIERTIVRYFGEDWDKSSTDKTEPSLPYLPSPPTHRPMLPRSEPETRPVVSWPPPPPPHYTLPPPPPPPVPCMLPPHFVPPPPPPCIIPPPPPPCIIPPPPPPFLPSISGFGGPCGHAPDHDRCSPPSSSRSSTPPLPPPPGWVPSVAFNPIQEKPSLSVESPIGQQENDETVHKGVTCDYCGKRNIKGTRYKCLQCPDYDWCSACMSSPKAWVAHSAEHAFFPIHKLEDFVHFCLVKDRRLRRQPVHTGITCDGCHQKNITGIRHKCVQCADFDFCDSCVSSPKTRLTHDMSHVFFPIKSPGMKEAYYKAREQVEQPSVIPPPVPQVQHSSIHCDGCSQFPLTGVRHKCLDCRDYDLCTSCISNSEIRAKHNTSHAFFPMATPADHTEYDKIRANHRKSNSETSSNTRRSSATQAQTRPVHKNIICDICNQQIVGVRHKCLDCADYDLCEKCISTPESRSRHHAQHQFFAIEKPGEVIVHTVFSGDGEREPMRPTQARFNPPTPAPRPRDVEPVVHNAMCNLCDSRIRGDRFKCLNCPDYDVCQLCYKITPEQHPDHGFVKVGEPAMLMIRDNANDAVHFASCNACGQRIKGVRYKCMHESCPDFDLCENCEAHPIAVHPITHPLLKIRIPGVVVPTILRPNEVTTPRIATPPLQYDIAREQSPITPAAPLLPFLDVEPLMNAPAHPPAIPLPQFTPDLNVPSLPQTRQPSPDMMQRPLTWYTWNPSPAFLPSPPVHPTAMLFAERTPSPATSPSIRASPGPIPIPAPITPPALPQPESMRNFELFGHTLATSEVAPEFLEPVPPLVDIDDSNHAPTVQEYVETEGTLGGISTPSEVPTTSASSSKSVPKLGPVNNDWNALWPELYTTFNHLLDRVTPPVEAASSSGNMPGAMVVEGPEPIEGVQRAMSLGVEVSTAVEESPLVGEPLLCRPLLPERPFNLGRSLSDLLGSVRPTIPTLPRLPTPPASITAIPAAEPESEATPAPAVVPFWQSVTRPGPALTAVFVSDSNIPGGQIFPPGAEFVKSWRMHNDGVVDWPESTELVFVAGDRMSPYNGGPIKVKVGSVKAGQEVELVSGEMKAPEVPGKYVSSWRLSDGNGNLFGNSVWVDITVAEMNETSSDESLASSLVIMPHAVQQTVSGRTTEGARFSTSSMTIPSAPSSIGGSSISLLDAVSSTSSDDDDAMYEDSRSREVPTPEAPVQDAEYVMLFDSSSSEDD
ncbi:hypothetical protein C8Q74DRAFT_1238467 [Fomes fomentarius]|nr:hypothetical protein C8Q74DRAFT_1238467 [Fomes fomentarius]